MILLIKSLLLRLNKRYKGEQLLIRAHLGNLPRVSREKSKSGEI